MTTPLSSLIDFDRIAEILVQDILWEAVAKWLRGRPLDEVALLNRLTERLGRRRRGCDVGVEFPVTASSTVAVLHREGEHQRDLFGSDLAVTATFDNPQFTKTAFFQLKCSEAYRVSIRRDQLLEATRDPRVGDRSFALAVDEARGGVRIHPVEDLLIGFSSASASKVIDCSAWAGLTQWVLGWLSCDMGPYSENPNSPRSVESLLGSYVVETTGDEFSWFGGEASADVPSGYSPTRSWLIFKFTAEET